MIRQLAGLAGQFARGRGIGLLAAGIGLVAAACTRREPAEDPIKTPIERDRLDRFVKKVLDRNGDRKLDPSELTPSQLSHILSGNQPVAEKDPAKAATQLAQQMKLFDTATVAQVVSALQRNGGNDLYDTAHFVTQVLQNEDLSRLELSGYQTQHVAEQMGLTVDECQLGVGGFEHALIDVLQGNPRPAAARYQSTYPTGHEAVNPQTFSNYPTVTVPHVDLDIIVDFEAQALHGVATWILGRKREDQLVLDIADMEILAVQVVGEDGQKKEIHPQIGRTATQPPSGSLVTPYGRPLSIALTPKTTKVIIKYRTVENTADSPIHAVNWTPADQTYSGRYPAMYTQGAPHMLTRGWFPLQDTPEARLTMNATIRVKENLGVKVAMSRTVSNGGQVPKPRREAGYKVWNYVVDKPMPGYVLGFVVGEFEGRRIGRNSVLYAEPHLIGQAARDFEDYQAYLDNMVKNFGPLPHVAPDLVVAYPSFPWGGMEIEGANILNNTTVTGDKSESWTAIHEGAHTFFGTEVTYRRLEDLWLVEAFTTYADHILTGDHFGADLETMIWMGDRIKLDEALMSPGEGQLTCLATKFPHKNPAKAITHFLYTKPSLFVKWIEQQMGGRQKMVWLLRRYRESFAGQSITTQDFVAFLDRETDIDMEKVHEWLYGPGLPKDAPTFHHPLMDQAKELATRWGSDKTTDFQIPNTTTWNPLAWVAFLESLFVHRQLPQGAMDALRVNYKMDQQTHPAIRAAWYALVAKNRYEPSYPGLERFFDGRMGRTRYVAQVGFGFAEGGDPNFGRKVYGSLRPRLDPLTHGYCDKLYGF